MHLYSILWILIIISSTLGSVIEKKNVRIRREKPPFVQTTCVLIDSVAKERCHTSATEHNEGHATQTQSCVTDEKFRVRYQIQDGEMITSTIQTYGRDFPRLMQIGESDTCYYNPQNVRMVRWTLTDEYGGFWWRILSIFAAVAGIMLVVGFFIYAHYQMKHF